MKKREVAVVVEGNKIREKKKCFPSFLSLHPDIGRAASFLYSFLVCFSCLPLLFSPEAIIQTDLSLYILALSSGALALPKLRLSGPHNLF